jgi:hypothetical protein
MWAGFLKQQAHLNPETNLQVPKHTRNFPNLLRDWELVVPSQPDRTHTPQVQNYPAKHRPSTRQNICESLQVISVKHSSVLPDDGSHKIRNMSE